jgi:hypothetical protein
MITLMKGYSMDVYEVLAEMKQILMNSKKLSTEEKQQMYDSLHKLHVELLSR